MFLRLNFLENMKKVFCRFPVSAVLVFISSVFFIVSANDAYPSDLLFFGVNTWTYGLAFFAAYMSSLMFEKYSYQNSWDISFWRWVSFLFAGVYLFLFNYLFESGLFSGTQITIYLFAIFLFILNA